MRSVFQFGPGVNWFPGHMVRSLRILEEKLKLCQIMIEVRDARVFPCLVL